MKYCPFQSKSSLWSIATKWLVDLFERCCVEYSALVSVAGRLDIQQQQYLDQAWWGEARAVELIHNLYLNVNWSNHSFYLVICCYFHVDAFWWASTCKEENFTLSPFPQSHPHASSPALFDPNLPVFPFTSYWEISQAICHCSWVHVYSSHGSLLFHTKWMTR